MQLVEELLLLVFPIFVGFELVFILYYVFTLYRLSLNGMSYLLQCLYGVSGVIWYIVRPVLCSILCIGYSRNTWF